MKKIILFTFTVMLMASSVQAHHNSPSDTAGGNISDMSGHLELFIG